MVKKVHKSVTKLGYRPNAIARSLKTKKADAIGILVPDISNPYFMQIIKGVEDLLMPQGYSLLFASSDENSAKEAKLLDVFSEKQIDALVLATAGGNDQQILKMHQLGIPIVLVDRISEQLAQELDYVVEDNFQSAYELASYFLAKGAGSFGVINGSMRVNTGLRRAEGFRQAIKDYGLNQENYLEYHGTFSEHDGSEAIKFFCEQGMPEVIIALNNLMGRGAIFQLVRFGYTIGEDVQLGLYGELDLAEVLPHFLPYIKQEPRKMGVRVGEILVQKLIKDKSGPFRHEFRQLLILTSHNQLKEGKK